jgi:predicted RNA-binding Zn-ribbon protein involved in translation (DUF1610 family)
MADMKLPDEQPLVICARCGQVMQHIRTVPSFGVLPEVRAFVCPSCGEVEAKGIPRQAQYAE